MPMTHASGAPPANGRFGPSLPTLLRRRFGIPVIGTVAAAALLLAIGVVAVLLRPNPIGDKQLVHGAEPVFNLLYRGGKLHPAAPRAGELARLEGARPGLQTSVYVRSLELPRYAGNVVHGLLPAYATSYTSRLRSAYPRFRPRDEGKARVNGAEGYQVGFKSGRRGDLTYGRDVMLVPAEASIAGGVLLSLRLAIQGPVSAKDKRLVSAARSAFRSFCFGRNAVSHGDC
jgi:hypothetical protein